MTADFGVIAWERAKFQIKCLLDEHLNDWEEKFVNDIAQRLELNPDYPFTDKQIDKIEQIWRKY